MALNQKHNQTRASTVWATSIMFDVNRKNVKTIPLMKIRRAIVDSKQSPNSREKQSHAVESRKDSTGTDAGYYSWFCKWRRTDKQHCQNTAYWYWQAGLAAAQSSLQAMGIDGEKDKK